MNKLLIGILTLILTGIVSAADYIGLDIRTDAELKANPAKGAMHIPMNKVDLETAKKLRGKKVKIFCEAGGRAEKIKKYLELNGVTDVENIGSWREWNQLQQTKK